MIRFGQLSASAAFAELTTKAPQPTHGGLATLSGVSFAFSTATLWRTDLGIGPGEIGLSIVFFWAFVVLLKRRHLPAKILRDLLPYSLVIVGVLFFSLIGLYIAFQAGHASEQWIRQYIFVGAAVLTPVLLVLTTGLSGVLRALAVYSAISVLGLLGILAFGIFSLSELIGLPAYVWGSRYSGWAQNPNQIALAVSVIPFVAIYLIQSAKWSFARGMTVLAGAVVIGIASASNALMVAWALTAGGFAAALFSGRQNSTAKSRLAALPKPYRQGTLFLGSLIGVGIFIFGSFWVSDNLSALFYGQIRGGSADQGSVRLALWSNAIEAFLMSPMFGLGPGHFSGLDGPFRGVEAHNLYIDWAASYGLVGVVALVCLFIIGFIRALKANNIAFAGALVVLIIISMFHFYARQPIFWIFLLLPLLALRDKR